MVSLGSSNTASLAARGAPREPGAVGGHGMAAPAAIGFARGAASPVRGSAMKARLCLIAIALSPGAIESASAQAYPSRPITMVVPYPAGGPSDTLGRILAESMRGFLGQPVVIENVSGAGGAIGVGRVARAAPDGYMPTLGHVQTHVINAATQTLQYDVVKDFEPVSLLADTPQWVVAKSAFPAASLQEMITWMKANPGKATVGAVGVGGPTDIAAI